jgi:ubiquinone/menaquinone biosynthesis C-methylase UbiE
MGPMASRNQARAVSGCPVLSGRCRLAVQLAVVLKKAMPSGASLSISPADRTTGLERATWVRETHFGRWFLGTRVWARYVVEVALADMVRLLPGGARRPRRILDAGCGPGVSLPLLDRHFSPESIIGIDINPQEVGRSRAQAANCRCAVEVCRGDAARLNLPDGAVDMVLCHQLLHHVTNQEAVLRELSRVLTPGGVLLLAESCRDFIHSTPVRLLFRHPDGVQKTAAEYQQLVAAAGFQFAPEHVITSTPFWSLPDWGFLQKLGWRRRPDAEPTEVTLVAFKPHA